VTHIKNKTAQIYSHHLKAVDIIRKCIISIAVEVMKIFLLFYVSLCYGYRSRCCCWL